MLSGMKPLVPVAVARVRAWLCTPDLDHLRVASDAGVDEKTIRLARNNESWSPTVETLRRLEMVMLASPTPLKKRRERAEQERAA